MNVENENNISYKVDCKKDCEADFEEDKENYLNM